MTPKIKKIAISLLVIIIFSVATFSPLFSQKAHAQGAPKTPGCGLRNAISEKCLLFMGAWIVYSFAWTPAAWFMGLMGKALDFSIENTVNGGLLRTLANTENSAVRAGWEVGRDIVNLLLIFILLFIAISTILQISKYGAKELLATLIIVAFMVNFSLVITKIIIDASNVFATEFYNAFPGPAGQKNLSDYFRQGIDVASLVENPRNATNNTSPEMYKLLILTYGFGAVIAAIAGFIFAVAAVLLIIRMVVLIILMIFSSFAFGAHILPSTKQHASKWWSTLFEQAFFAPAMFFMLLIAAKLVNSGFIRDAIQSAVGNSQGQSVNFQFQSSFISAGNPDPLAPVDWGTAAYILNFIVIIIMTLASLVVAKKMSAFGAESVIAGGLKAINKAQGYAGRITKRGAGYVSEKVLQRAEEGREKGGRWISRTIAGGPGAGRGLARMSSWREQQLKERKEKLEKKYAGYSRAGVAALAAEPKRNILLPKEKEVIQKLEEKKKQEAFEKEEATKKRHEKEYSKSSEKELQDVIASPIATELQKEAAKSVLGRREEASYRTSSLQLMRELIEAQKTQPSASTAAPLQPKIEITTPSSGVKRSPEQQAEMEKIRREIEESKKNNPENA